MTEKANYEVGLASVWTRLCLGFLAVLCVNCAFTSLHNLRRSFKCFPGYCKPFTSCKIPQAGIIFSCKCRNSIPSRSLPAGFIHVTREAPHVRRIAANFAPIKRTRAPNLKVRLAGWCPDKTTHLIHSGTKLKAHP